MNEMQTRFFEHLSNIQNECVEVCMLNHKITDENTKSMLYDITYEITVRIMETIDGYSGYSDNKHDIINTVTQERLKADPFIELHDEVTEYLKYK